MEKLASQLLDKAKTFVEENPGLVTGLVAAGGAGALGGAALTSPSGDPDETPGDLRLRRLKNALLGATMGAGAVGLGAYGLKQFNTALPVDDVDPVTKAWYSPVARGIGAVTGGATVAALVNRAQKAKADMLLKVMGDTRKYVNPKAALSTLLKGNAPVVKGGLKAQEALLNALTGKGGAARGAGKAISKALTQAGISGKVLSTPLDYQGTVKGLFRFTKLKPGIVKNVLRSTARGIARNKWTALAALGSLAIPEVGDAVVKSVSSLFGDSHE